MKKRLLPLVVAITLMFVSVVSPIAYAATCGTRNTQIGKKDAGDKDTPVQTSVDYNCKGNGNAITSLLLAFVNFLAIGVGIAVVGGIVFGALRYASASGNAAQAQQGVTYIVNSLIGLFLFIFMYAAINFLVPGGLFT